MSALTNLSHHIKPLSFMTDDELQADHKLWYQELSSQNRWGLSPEVALQAIEEIEVEQLKRALTIIRSGRGRTHLRLVETAPQPIEIIVMGAGKARAEWKPRRVFVIGVAAALVSLLVGATALAGQRLVEFNDQYGWELV